MGKTKFCPILEASKLVGYAISLSSGNLDSFLKAASSECSEDCKLNVEGCCDLGVFGLEEYEYKQDKKRADIN